MNQEPNTKPSPAQEELRPEDIAKLAHEIWAKRGFPPRSAQEDWLEAETELKKGKANQEVKEIFNPGGSVQR